MIDLKKAYDFGKFKTGRDHEGLGNYDYDSESLDEFESNTAITEGIEEVVSKEHLGDLIDELVTPRNETFRDGIIVEVEEIDNLFKTLNPIGENVYLSEQGKVLPVRIRREHFLQTSFLFSVELLFEYGLTLNSVDSRLDAFLMESIAKEAPFIDRIYKDEAENSDLLVLEIQYFDINDFKIDGVLPQIKHALILLDLELKRQNANLCANDWPFELVK